MSNGQLSVGEGYRQAADTEPLPGYRLLHPLGRGGFGEVWKCEAPGGLHKAVKFVYPDSDADDGPGDSLRQEYEAFQHVKTIRHPFLLMLERVELVNGVLVSVMELADAGLADRFAECVAGGLPGIPRPELLGYLTDAAEALDVIAVKHGLQHLDIKPANLFLVGGHVKVGDYGLVSRSNPVACRQDAGFTPRYAPPELLDGLVDPRSDQYSLALVYFEMLTGSFPFKATSAKALMLAHAATAPDLTALPAGDRPVVARALAKAPADRFPDCLGFLRALLTAGPPPPSDVTLRQARMGRLLSADGGPAVLPPPDVAITRSRMPAPGAITPSAPVLRTPGQSGVVTGLMPPRLATLTPALPPPAPRPAKPPGPEAAGLDLSRPADAGPPSVVPLTAAQPDRLARPMHHLTHGFRAVLPVPVLTGGVWLGADPPAGAAFARSLFAAVHGPGPLPAAATDPVRRPDGTWACRFPARLMAPTVRLKLEAVRDQWGGTLLHPEPTRFQLRLGIGRGRSSWLGKSEHTGLAVDLELPPPAAADGDVTVVGRLYGPLDAAGARRATDALPRILSDLRSQLQNLPDRRKSPRVAYAGPLLLYPVDEDGGVFPAVPAQGVDVSPTGLCCRPAGPVATRYVYAELPPVTALAGLALLVELIRKGRHSGDAQVAGMFRLDLDDPDDDTAATVRATRY